MAGHSILIIGMGSFGASLAQELARLGHDVIGVDKDPAVVQEMAQALRGVVEMDAASMDALRTLDVRSFDICVVGKGQSLEDSVLTTLNLKELGARRIICKAMTEQQARILERIGADHVVFPERDMGQRLAMTLTSAADIMGFLSIPGGFGIEELAAPRGWVGKTLAELALPARHGLQLLVLKTKDKVATMPGPEVVLSEGDIMVVFGHENKLGQLRQ